LKNKRWGGGDEWWSGPVSPGKKGKKKVKEERVRKPKRRGFSKGESRVLMWGVLEESTGEKWGGRGTPYPLVGEK